MCLCCRCCGLRLRQATIRRTLALWNPAPLLIINQLQRGDICARRVGRMPRNPKCKCSIYVYDKQLYFIKKLTNNQQNVF